MHYNPLKQMLFSQTGKYIKYVTAQGRYVHIIFT